VFLPGEQGRLEVSKKKSVLIGFCHKKIPSLVMFNIVMKTMAEIIEI
jgi:hypothetical protein